MLMPSLPIRFVSGSLKTAPMIFTRALAIMRTTAPSRKLCFALFLVTLTRPSSGLYGTSPYMYTYIPAKQQYDAACTHAAKHPAMKAPRAQKSAGTNRSCARNYRGSRTGAGSNRLRQCARPRRKTIIRRNAYRRNGSKHRPCRSSCRRQGI